jgi:hypothetical protein
MIELTISQETLATIRDALKSQESTLAYNFTTGSKNLCGTMDESKQKEVEYKLYKTREVLKMIESIG